MYRQKLLLMLRSDVEMVLILVMRQYHYLHRNWLCVAWIVLGIVCVAGP
jgi:hypothetical protein